MPTTAYRPPTQLIRYSRLDSVDSVEGYIARPHKPVNVNNYVIV